MEFSTSHHPVGAGATYKGKANIMVQNQLLIWHYELKLIEFGFFF
jgi:hypothetical protein